MSKIICDICGTTYPETAQCCPICGYSLNPAEDLEGENLMEDNTVVSSNPFSSRRKEIFDFDEVNAESEDEVYEDEDDEEAYAEDEYAEDDYEEEDDEEPRHNTLVVILLTVLIVGLLAVAGFVFVRYFLPNMKTEEAAPAQTAAAMQELSEDILEATIPCETLIISSGNVAELNEEGQHFLLHIKALPENTTDKIIYTSADESIATVTEDGKITAISEGETKIYISCGKSSIECPVIIRYVEETVPATEAPVVEETEPAVENTTPVVEALDPDETVAPAVPAETKPGVTLKLKKTDIMLGVYYQFTLELDCDLQQNEVKWSSEHPHIATVDENGVVTAVKSGTTAITATYGDQTVTCMVRCSW